jgi:predicted  nucleic acid-binding Zn-ribbon protein
MTELEETNTRLEELNAEMRLIVSGSDNAVTAMHHELDEEIEHIERLRLTNAHLLNEHNEMRSWVTNLEMKLAEMEAGVAKNIATLEARLAETEAHTA